MQGRGALRGGDGEPGVGGEPEQEIDISRYDGRGGDGGGEVQRVEGGNKWINNLPHVSLIVFAHSAPLVSCATCPQPSPPTPTPSGPPRP